MIDLLRNLDLDTELSLLEIEDAIKCRTLGEEVGVEHKPLRVLWMLARNKDIETINKLDALIYDTTPTECSRNPREYGERLPAGELLQFSIENNLPNIWTTERSYEEVRYKNITD